MAPVSPLQLNLGYRLPLVGFCLLIFWQSSFPSIASTSWLPQGGDKVLHLGGYALLAFLAARNLRQEKPLFTRTKIRIMAIVFTSLYGLSDEIHQAFVPSRTASGMDFLADVLGSILGTWLYLDVFSRKKW